VYTYANIGLYKPVLLASRQKMYPAFKLYTIQEFSGFKFWFGECDAMVDMT